MTDPEQQTAARRLARLLRQKREDIVTEWGRRVLSDPAIPHADALSIPRLRDHIPDFLDALATSMESPDLRHRPEEQVSRIHAHLRSLEGYGLHEALKELTHLRATIGVLCIAGTEEGPGLLHSAIDRVLLEVAAGLTRLNAESEHQLRQANEQFRLLVEGVKDYAIFKMDAFGGITSWNPGVKRLLGYEADEFIGKNLALIFTAEDRAAGLVASELQRATLEDSAPDIRWHERKDGTLFFAEGTVTALKDKLGRVNSYAKIMHDATARRLNDDALAENEERLLLALASARMICWEWWPVQRRLKLTGDVQALYGDQFAPGTSDVDVWMEAIHPDDRERVRATIKAAVDEHKPFFVEYRVVWLGGQVHWLSARGRAQHDERGQLHRVLAVTTEVTERKEAELALSAHAAALEEKAALLDLTADAVLVKDDDTIVSWNHGAEELYGYANDEAVGNVAHDLLKTTFPEPLVAIKQTLQSKGRWVGELVHVTRSGEEITVMSRWALRRKLGGAAARVLETNTDITARKLAERDLRRAKEMAEAASREKSQFLANMSHEIRTPLGAILGFSELLKNPDLPHRDQAHYLGIIDRNGKELATLIDDILDLSKVEAGRLEIDAVTMSLPTLLADVTGLLRVKAQEKGIRFVTTFKGAVPSTIQSDPTRLRQILLNVVGNAVKFTKEGSVSIEVMLAAQGRGQELLGFVVKDTGQGISAAERARLFQPFRQANSTTTRNFGGTGLGLALSRNLARALGGDVTLTHSQPAKGTTFTITIDPGPLAGVRAMDELSDTLDDPSPAGRDATSSTLAGVKLLVADDSTDNQLLIKTVVSLHGAAVEMVGDGVAAVEAALHGDFDVVLMDIQMPRLDGYGATEELRRRGYTKPIIALTAYAMRDEREKSLRSGCNDHLTKPLNLGRLVYVVAQYAQGRRQHESIIP